jgi:hypothetical protein
MFAISLSQMRAQFGVRSLRTTAGLIAQYDDGRFSKTGHF